MDDVLDQIRFLAGNEEVFESSTVRRIVARNRHPHETLWSLARLNEWTAVRRRIRQDLSLVHVRSPTPPSSSALEEENSHETLLQYAARNGHIAEVRWLVGHAGADIFVHDDQRRTPLRDACFHRHGEIVHYLLQAAQRQNERELVTGRRDNIHGKLDSFSIPIADRLQWYTNLCDSSGQTALHHVARVGSATMLQALLRVGTADPNCPCTPLGASLSFAQRHTLGQTPWHVAFWYNRPAEIVRTLWEAGADPHAVDGRGNTALHCAGYQGYTNAKPAVLEILIEAIAVQQKVSSDDDQEPRDLGVGGTTTSSTKCANILNVVNHAGDTALHQAAWWGNTHNLRLFLRQYEGDQAADASIRNHKGQTPLHVWWTRRKPQRRGDSNQDAAEAVLLLVQAVAGNQSTANPTFDVFLSRRRRKRKPAPQQQQQRHRPGSPAANPQQPLETLKQPRSFDRVTDEQSEHDPHSTDEDDDGSFSLLELAALAGATDVVWVMVRAVAAELAALQSSTR